MLNCVIDELSGGGPPPLTSSSLAKLSTAATGDSAVRSAAPPAAKWGFYTDVVNKMESARFHFNTQRMSKIPATNLALEGSSSLDMEAERGRTLIVLSETRAGIGAARHAERRVTHLYLEEIYEIKRFVEVTGSRSPQADSMVLFGAFCNFLCTRRKKQQK